MKKRLRILYQSIILVFILLQPCITEAQKLGDNLGSHKATKDLDMNLHNIVNSTGMVIGQATFTNNSIIVDIRSSTKALAIPRITNIALMTPGDVVNGMMAYDVATNRFCIRENGRWVTFGSFELSSGSILIGNASNVAVQRILTGDVTIDNLGVATIGTGKVTFDKLGSTGIADANKVFGTNSATGVPQLISQNDLAIPKFTLSERDLIASPANNMLIFNKDTRTLQIYDSAIPAWVNTGSAASSNLPTVSTVVSTATSTKPDTAYAGGAITNPNTIPITSRGVCWNIATNPTTANFATVDGAGAGSFSSILYGLKPSTLYYVKAYAVNALGTTYGNEVTITTNTAGYPVLLATVAAIDITNSSANSGGTVSSDRGAAVTARGLVWNITGSPDINNTKTSNGVGIGTFESSLTGLTASTLYYIRAYATNSTGTAYGLQKTFTSAAASLPEVATAVPTQTASSATVGGNVTNTGGAPVTSRGFYYSTTVAAPTSAQSTLASGQGSGVFTGTMSGLIQNTQYYLRAFAINSSGTGYGAVTSFVSNGLPIFNANSTGYNSLTPTTVNLTGSLFSDGGDATTVAGFVWDITPNPTINKVTGRTGTGGYVSSITGLTSGVTYYARTFATNNFGTVYGPEISFKNSGTITFNFVPDGGPTFSNPASFTIPAGVTSINIKCWGASGGGAFGGQGGYAEGKVTTIAPGTVLAIYVGGQGQLAPNSGGNGIAPGGWNGGGTGYGDSNNGSGGGGGGSDVRIGGTGFTNRIIAAGGGGGGNGNVNYRGGNGGGTVGLDGASDSGASYTGKGGTQSAGGAGASAFNVPTGTLGVGGNSARVNSQEGGGGGGFYGGGGAGSGGGGGGSGGVSINASYTMSNPVFAAGGNVGNGKITISW